MLFALNCAMIAGTGTYGGGPIDSFVQAWNFISVHFTDHPMVHKQCSGALQDTVRANQRRYAPRCVKCRGMPSPCRVIFVFRHLKGTFGGIIQLRYLTSRKETSGRVCDEDAYVTSNSFISCQILLLLSELPCHTSATSVDPR
jgi:hypothetical protein